MKRRSALVALVVIACATTGACRCRSRGAPSIDQPPVRPPDVLIELVVRDPTTSWERVHELLGLLALPLPRKPFGALAPVVGLPKELEGALDPSGPLVGLVCEGTPQLSSVIAWKVDDPERLATFDPQRFTLAKAHDGVRWWRRTIADLPAARVPVGLVGGFLVAGSAESIVAQHASYLLRGPGNVLASADLRIDLTVAGARADLVRETIDRGLAVSESLDSSATNAPSSSTTVAKDLGALLGTLRDWSQKSEPFRLEVSIRKDAIAIEARALEGPESPAITIEIPGDVVRWWVRAQALGGLAP